MNFEEEDNRLIKWFLILSVLVLLVFTIFDIIGILPVVSDGLKLSGTVLCFLFSVLLLFIMGAELDRLMLMFSLLFAIAADALLLFTDYYFCGVLVFCAVQEFHSIRIFSIKKSIVRMDGRIALDYRNYKIWRGVLLTNCIQLLLAAVPFVISLFVKVPYVELISACVFYITGFAGNLIRLSRVSRDVRLLDDMRPLRSYFAGMLLYFACDLLIGLFRLPEYLPVFQGLTEYTNYAMLVVWPLYLAGLVCIALSGYRRQSFYS